MPMDSVNSENVERLKNEVNLKNKELAILKKQRYDRCHS